MSEKKKVILINDTNPAHKDMIEMGYEVIDAKSPSDAQVRINELEAKGYVAFANFNMFSKSYPVCYMEKNKFDALMSQRLHYDGTPKPVLAKSTGTRITPSMPRLR